MCSRETAGGIRTVPSCPFAFCPALGLQLSSVLGGSSPASSCDLKSIQAGGRKEKKNMKDPTASVCVVAAKKQVKQCFQVLLSVSVHLTSVQIVVLAISALP